jgi:hypothetical protein
VSPVFNPDNNQEHHMQFASKSEQQIQEENLIPAGEYDFTVQEAKEGQSKKSGKDMITLDMDIYVGDRTRPMKDWLMETMAYKLRHFCYATGLGAKYEAGTLTAADCEGKSGKLTLVIRDGDRGKQNSVKDYLVPVAGESAEVPPAIRKPAPAPVDDPNAPPF